MTCPACGGDQLAFRVPDDLRAHLPEESAAVAICTTCLTLEPTELSATPAESSDSAGVAEELPDFGAISDAFPTGDAGAAMALAVGLLDSLALYRSELSALLERVEREGADPLLVVDRLTADESVDPHFDAERRRTQVEQLLYG